MKALYAVVLFSFVLNVSFIASLERKDKEIINLNEEMESTVAQYNELNHRYNEKVMEVSVLRDANENLIRHCRPCDVNNAIKDTKLPPLKG